MESVSERVNEWDDMGADYSLLTKVSTNESITMIHGDNSIVLDLVCCISRFCFRFRIYGEKNVFAIMRRITNGLEYKRIHLITSINIKWIHKFAVCTRYTEVKPRKCWSYCRICKWFESMCHFGTLLGSRGKHCRNYSKYFKISIVRKNCKFE